jgi:hypothetical protein
LLSANPFEQVQWVEVDNKIIRQFGRDELKSLLSWKFVGGCPLVSLFAKISLWACGRLEEMTELRWDWVDSEGYISIPDEKAKWGKGKMFRIPLCTLAELERYRTESPFVWAGYVDQLRDYHKTTGHGSSASKVKDFNPQRLRISFQKWIGQWSRMNKVEGLSHHAFRRTGLQWSREGQLRSSESVYAQASNVGLDVADKHYTTKPKRIWANITYRNIASEIEGDSELASMMGSNSSSTRTIITIEDVQAALAQGNYEEANRLLALLRG